MNRTPNTVNSASLVPPSTGRSIATIVRATAGVLCALLIASCATVHGEVAKPVSSALAPATDTPSARYIQSELVKHAPSVSGFRLLTLSTNALLSRITLIDHAEHSIDLQYFIYKNDATGRLVSLHLLAAADRGVRVRMLLDDANMDNERDMLDALDAHPNIEVRLFNPFRSREASKPSKLVQMLLESSRLNRRMHNKSFIVDNKIAVVGGRNIGDDYFDASTDNNFRDLDLVAIGPVVAETSRTFDQYWNSDAAVLASAFPNANNSHGDLAALRLRLAKASRAFLQSDYVQAAFEELPDGATADRRGQWFWGNATLVADAADEEDNAQTPRGLRVGATLQATFDAAQRDVVLMSPYFLPSDDNVAELLALIQRGVSVSVLTNSLASTDEIAVYAKYAPRRKPLLEGGVKLYELRPSPTANAQTVRHGTSSGVSLHAKAFVVDDHITFVGSLNLDPRSALINTEMGLIVDNPALAKAVTDFFTAASQPGNAYQLQLSGAPAVPRTGSVIWQVDDHGTARRVKHEPETPASLRIKMFLMRLLPIDGLL